MRKTEKVNRLSNFKVLIPAAGKGTRTGLSKPKTLAKVGAVPIIVRLLQTVHELDSSPVVVVSPKGKKQIAQTLNKYSLTNVELLVQDAPRGMGDAVLQLTNSKEYNVISHVLVIWGDQPFVQIKTLHRLIDLYKKSKCVLAFPTIMADDCYTIVERDRQGEVIKLLESRETDVKFPVSGERDTGIFLFQKTVVMQILAEELDELKGKVTGEKGFLAVISVLVKRGYNVKAFPIATKLDYCGFNTPDELGKLNEIIRVNKSLTP